MQYSRGIDEMDKNQSIKESLEFLAKCWDVEVELLQQDARVAEGFSLCADWLRDWIRSNEDDIRVTMKE